MRFIYFWMLFALQCRFGVQGSGGNVPKRTNGIYHWNKQTIAAQNSPYVAKYREEKHLNIAQNSSRRLFGRHVCTQNQVVMLPVKDVQSYCKPAYQSFLRRCDKDTTRFCTGYRVAYELSYRTIQRMVAKTESSHSCCPGWTQMRSSSSDCKKAVCRQECRNGGVCTKPDHCSCPPGWTGKTCETDVNECSQRNNFCEQECINVPGSYKCSCREGYSLHPNGRNCNKEIARHSNAEDISELLKKIEDMQQRLSALEGWKRRSFTEEQDNRHARDERINSLSEQIAILEERLAEYVKHHQEFTTEYPDEY
ncbi:epidermal growth factor-like protein 8 isoform X2 [Stegodyphus dumicola]|uniref:epidermal growth factor-like protein 8 isoform X2 n=1 Tax=Stegodyphus dumicola TaxID=202533 RepID=UPI0015AD99E5|nr:epidermal growth factor-like protein 8 isoform X2 [Stegodyphus dumicola]